MLIQKPRIPIKEVLLIGFLPCFLKKIIYRLKGYQIGRACSIGFGSVICGKEVAIGEYTKIGFFTIIRGNRIIIGSHVSIGSATFLDTPIIEIGDDSKINEQVFVGGLQLPDSKFVIGKNCQIMQMTFINPAVSVTMGHDSGCGGYCLIFGHSSWNSQFEGYPVEFAPVEFGDNVSLTWRVFVMPGVKIGDGSVIGPDSLVNRDIPPQCLAAGFPARVIGKYPEFPKEVTEAQKIDILKNIETEMIKFFNGSGLPCDYKGNYYEIVHRKKVFLRRKDTIWKLKFIYDAIDENESPNNSHGMHVLVSLKSIPRKTRMAFNAEKTMWLDIEKKERPLFWNDFGDEVALFIRRYGVRFNRVND